MKLLHSQEHNHDLPRRFYFICCPFRARVFVAAFNAGLGGFARFFPVFLNAAIGQLVPVDTGHYCMLKTQRSRTFGDPARLVRVECPTLTGLNRAKSAGARAGIAEDHEGGGFFGPAFTEVKAAGLLAYRHQLGFTH